MLSKIKEASVKDLQIWMLSAGITGFGLGSFFGNLLSDYSVLLVIIGAGIHVWAMYKIYYK